MNASLLMIRQIWYLRWEMSDTFLVFDVHFMHLCELFQLFTAQFFLTLSLDEFVAVLADLLGEHDLLDHNVLEGLEIIIWAMNDVTMDFGHVHLHLSYLWNVVDSLVELWQFFSNLRLNLFRREDPRTVLDFFTLDGRLVWDVRGQRIYGDGRWLILTLFLGRRIELFGFVIIFGCG